MTSSSLPPTIQLPSPAVDGNDTTQYLVFFIPGNPGPVAYYRTFLSSLHASLNSSDTSPLKATCFEIYGRSLSKLDEDNVASSEKLPPPSLSTSSSMAELVQDAEVALLEAVERAETAHAPKVILVGHCAGAYIALELLKRWQHQRKGAEEGDIGKSMGKRRFDAAGSVCLFPSVPINTVAGTVSQAVLSTLSNSALLVHTSVKFLLFLVPSEVIQMLLRSTAGLSDDAAKITGAMLGSKWGVYQALKLWRSQMDDQKNGRWDDVIYTSGAAASPPTYMLFGQNDGEPLIGRRGRDSLEPVAGIHKSELPDHFFTTQEDSESVAELVKEYVEEIVRLDGRE